MVVYFLSMRKKTNILWPSLIFHTDDQSSPKLSPLGKILAAGMCLLESAAKKLKFFQGPLA